jgi:hypothetical protein
MTPNDTQMDVLMRRYAKRATERSLETEHLDPDELNAFAQTTLPPAARSRYVSHLADCDDCRRLASQLTTAAGAKSELVTAPSDPIGEVSWWERLKVVLAPASLRYAAFAIVLVAVAGITFVVWRQPRQENSQMVARNAPATAPAEGLRERAAIESENKQSTQTSGSEPRAVARPTAELALNKKEDLAVSPPAPAKAASETAPAETKSGLADNRATEPARTAATPSYAPPPAAENERSQARGREQQGLDALTPSGPRKNESYDKYKVDRARAGEAPKDEDRGRVASNQPLFGNTGNEEAAARDRRDSRTSSVQRGTISEMRVETQKAATSVRDEANEAPQTRAAGGRKFQRRGNAWVDVKFKSSMSVKNISRGSDDYDELDSGLRSIAQQIGGEVVVVWKGKAYRFK